MYESIIVDFDLATRDQNIDNIKQQIKQKQSFLINKSRERQEAIVNLAKMISERKSFMKFSNKEKNILLNKEVILNLNKISLEKRRIN